jgi:glycosyltransferase involved in cell wall biosynthesis
MNKPRLLRITTVPMSLHYLLGGQFAFMQSQGFEVLAVSSDGPEVGRITSEGVRHVVVPLTRKITPLSDLYCLFRLVGVMRSFRPSIVHTHTPKAGLLGMAAAWICRVPVRLHTVAGLPYFGSRGARRALLKLADRISFRLATRVYPNSIRLNEIMAREFGRLNGKAAVIGRGSSNGIDTTYFQRSPDVEEKASAIRAGNGIGTGDIVYSFIGRIVRDKGIVELVEAFKAVQQRRPGTWLILAGPFEGDLDPLPEKTSDEIRSNPHILAPGFQTDVRGWMAASDVFVFPSYREGFPNVLMQAACLGVPCIATDINGCNEIVRDQRTGLLVQVRDKQGLAEAMARLAGDPGLRKRMGEEGRRFVSENFRREEVWGLLLKEYRTQLELP